MKVFSRVALVALVILSFSAGLWLRAGIEHQQASSQITQQYDPISDTRIASTTPNVDLRPLQTLVQVVRHVRDNYVEPITPKEEGKMTYDMLKAMLGSLKDPNTRFIEPDERKVIADAMEGTFHGIGAFLAIRQIKSGDLNEEHLIVISTLPNSPAAEAGLKFGDDITEINGNSILPYNPLQKAEKMIKDARASKKQNKEIQKMLEGEEKRIENGIPITEAVKKLMSEDGKDIELTILRKGEKKELKVKLQTRKFTVEPIASSIVEDGKFGYVKINCFTNKTAEELEKALNSMESSGVKGLLLDLRGLGGGTVAFVAETASKFTPGGKLAILAMSRGRKSQIKIPESDYHWKKPIAVLVDSSTARMGEVLAAQLRDSAGAKIIGQRTYGDLVHTTLIDQRDGSAIMMKTGVFLTDKQKNYNEAGIPVDIAVASNEKGPMIKAAVKALLESRS